MASNNVVREAKMNNFFFAEARADDRRIFVIPGEFEGDYLMYGNIVREGFQANSCARTSLIERCFVEDKTVYTASGTKYTLEDMSEDYKEFLEAVKENTPVLREWRLEGNLRKGYVISGNAGGKDVDGKIASQNRNFVTLEDGTTYFVLWGEWTDFGMCALLAGKYLDMDYKEDFEKFAGFKCRPVLFPKLNYSTL